MITVQIVVLATVVPVRVVLRGGDNSGGHRVAALAMEGFWDGVVVGHF